MTTTHWVRHNPDIGRGAVVINARGTAGDAFSRYDEDELRCKMQEDANGKAKKASVDLEELNISPDTLRGKIMKVMADGKERTPTDIYLRVKGRKESIDAAIRKLVAVGILSRDWILVEHDRIAAYRFNADFTPVQRASGNSSNKCAMVLSIIYKNPGITRPDLAAKIDLTPDYVSRLVSGLAADGFVRCDRKFGQGGVVQYYASAGDIK